MLKHTSNDMLGNSETLTEILPSVVENCRKFINNKFNQPSTKFHTVEQ